MITSDGGWASKYCEACGEETDEENCSYVGVGTPIAKALNIDDLSAEGPLIVCEECFEGALDYITSGAFQQSGYEPMPQHR